MRTVTKRELNQETARVLAQVSNGESVVVTERGIPKWQIEAIGAHPDPIERLRAEGRLTPAKANPRPLTAHAGPPRYTAAQIQALLDETRGDR